MIAWSEDRPVAVATMREALAASVIERVETNLPFLQRVFASEDSAVGRIPTRSVDEHLHEIMMDSGA